MSKSESSLRKSIDLKCKDCIYDPSAQGTWRAQVERCTATRCPLFNCRPKPIKKTDKDLS